MVNVDAFYASVVNVPDVAVFFSFQQAVVSAM